MNRDFVGPLSASQVDRTALVLAATTAAGVAVLFLRRRPKLSAVLFLFVLAFVPVWLGLTVNAYFMPVTVTALFLLAVHLPGTLLDAGLGDLIVIFFLVACLLPTLGGGSTRSTVFTALTEWTLPYLLARVFTVRVEEAWIHRWVAAVFTVVSLLALVEFFFHFNPFVHLMAANPLFKVWGTLQERGGALRAEGAFGHSIALGVSVAMAIPFALASPFTLRTRLLMTALMVGCTAVTFSRIAMICAALAVVSSVLFIREEISARVRAAIIVVFGVVATVLIPLISSTFSAAGSEATNSASYRGDLTSLLPAISVLGFSPDARRSPAGDLIFGRFRSIDSALILLGLTYGWLAVFFAVVLVFGAITFVATGRATPATIAVVAGTPALLSVALITQYGTWVWFVGGLAVGTQIERRLARRPIDDQLDRRPYAPASTLSFVAGRPQQTGSARAVSWRRPPAIGPDDHGRPPQASLSWDPASDDFRGSR